MARTGGQGVSETVVSLGRTNWADWCHDRDLVFARHGCLYRLGFRKDDTLKPMEQVQLLDDMTSDSNPDPRTQTRISSQLHQNDFADRYFEQPALHSAWLIVTQQRDTSVARKLHRMDCKDPMSH